MKPAKSINKKNKRYLSSNSVKNLKSNNLFMFHSFSNSYVNKQHRISVAIALACHASSNHVDISSKLNVLAHNAGCISTAYCYCVCQNHYTVNENSPHRMIHLHTTTSRKRNESKKLSTAKQKWRVHVRLESFYRSYLLH